jgi:hypothetical protein
MRRGGSSDAPGRIIRCAGEDHPMRRGGSSDAPGRNFSLTPFLEMIFLSVTL